MLQFLTCSHNALQCFCIYRLKCSKVDGWDGWVGLDGMEISVTTSSNNHIVRYIRSSLLYQLHMLPRTSVPNENDMCV